MKKSKKISKRDGYIAGMQITVFFLVIIAIFTGMCYNKYVSSKYAWF